MALASPLSIDPTRVQVTVAALARAAPDGDVSLTTAFALTAGARMKWVACPSDLAVPKRALAPRQSQAPTIRLARTGRHTREVDTPAPRLKVDEVNFWTQRVNTSRYCRPMRKIRKAKGDRQSDGKKTLCTCEAAVPRTLAGILL